MQELKSCKIIGKQDQIRCFLKPINFFPISLNHRFVIGCARFELMKFKMLFYRFAIRILPRTRSLDFAPPPILDNLAGPERKTLGDLVRKLLIYYYLNLILLDREFETLARSYAIMESPRYWRPFDIVFNLLRCLKLCCFQTSYKFPKLKT